MQLIQLSNQHSDLFQNSIKGLFSALHQEMVQVVNLGQVDMPYGPLFWVLIQTDKPVDLMQNSDLSTCLQQNETSIQVFAVDRHLFNQWHERSIRMKEQPHLTLTLIGSEFRASLYSDILALCDEFGVQITGGLPHPGALQQLVCQGDRLHEVALRKGIQKLGDRYKVDMAFRPGNAAHSPAKLVVFDMDSTLIQQEVIDELAKEAGVSDKVIAITERAMAGELDFRESLIERVALLKGLSADSLNKVANRLVLSEGVDTLISHLRQVGCKVAIASGGFDFFARILQNRLSLDFVYANQLVLEGGCLTGRVAGDIVDAQYKADVLTRLTGELGLQRHQTVAIGDGANDLLMLAASGLGIAYRAKPVVREKADFTLTYNNLDSLIPLLG